MSTTRPNLISRSLLQCLSCTSPLDFYDSKRRRCDLCRKNIMTQGFGCEHKDRHGNYDTFDVCLACAKRDVLFDFDTWLITPGYGGPDWLREIWIPTHSGKLQYTTPLQSWEDICRDQNSSHGSLIFDVAVEVKKPGSPPMMRRVLRPSNFTDQLQTIPLAQISMAVGQVQGQPLRAYSLQEILSSPALLKACGMEMELSEGSLYVEEQDGKSAGAASSVGCTLLMEEDLGHPYEVKSFLYPSSIFPEVSYLAFVQTVEGTTCTFMPMGIECSLKFVKDGKVCNWVMNQFDLSTEEGKTADRTGCNPSSDMLIAFVPVCYDPPLAKDEEDDAKDDDEEMCVTKGGGSVWKAKSKGKPKAKGSSKPLTYTFGSSSLDLPASRGGSDHQSAGFGELRMHKTSETFQPVVSDRKIRREGKLSVRVFSRGQVYLKNEPGNRAAALQISNYLESKMKNVNMISIFGYSAQAQARAKFIKAYIPEQTYDSATKNDDYTDAAELDEEYCVICMELPITQVFIPCGHLCCCLSCSKKLGKICPLCRAPIVHIRLEKDVDKSEHHIIPLGCSK